MKIFKRLVLLNESMKAPSGWWQDTKCLAQLKMDRMYLRKRANKMNFK